MLYACVTYIYDVDVDAGVNVDVNVNIEMDTLLTCIHIGTDFTMDVYT